MDSRLSPASRSSRLARCTAADEHPDDRRRDDEDQPDGERDERQVDEQHGVGPADQVAHLGGVAEQRLPVGGRARLERAQRQPGDLVVELAAEIGVDAERHALHEAAPPLAQREVERDRDRHADGEALERRQTGVEHHAVIDLEHEDRGRERDDVDEQRENEQLAELAEEGPRERPQEGAHRGACRSRTGAWLRLGRGGAFGHAASCRSPTWTCSPAGPTVASTV
jgi:hypothetical protein